MVKWSDVCAAKDFWGHRYFGVSPHEYGLDAKMGMAEILKDDRGLCPLLACKLKEGSQFWITLQDIKHEIRTGCTHSIGDEAGTPFWLDLWLDGYAPRADFPDLFVICSDPVILVAGMTRSGWVITFRRDFALARALSWDTLQPRLPDALMDAPDSVS
jgi:hypothetical protein